MSELLERHTPYELNELFVAEQFWPVGEPAANLRALLTGKLCKAAISGGDVKELKTIWQMLEGTFEPPVPVRELTKEQKAERAEHAKRAMKAAFGIAND